MTEDKKSVLEHVHPARREFLKNLLAGAAFAAPVIATFSIDALTANSAFALGAPNLISNQCPTDVGYEGPQHFEAHLSLSPTTSVKHRVNGQATFDLTVVGGSVTQITGIIQMVLGTTITKAEILFGTAVLVLTLSGGAFTISDFSLAKDLICDLDELADAMASSNVTMQVNCSYLGSAYTLTGKLIPGSFPIV